MSTHAIERGLIGQPMLLSLVDGRQQPVRTDSLWTSETNVVVFWTRGNSFSILELDALHELTQQCDHCRIIAVNVDLQDPTQEDFDSVSAFVADKGYDFTLLFDPGLKSFGLLGVAALPSTFIVDSTGTLLWGMAGYLVADRQPLLDRIRHVEDASGEGMISFSPKAIRYHQMARRMLRNREFRMADVNLTFAITADTTFPDPLVTLAELRAMEGDFDGADSLLSRSLIVDSMFTPALRMRAWLAFISGNGDAADRWAARTLTFERSDPLGVALSGWSAAHRAQADSARSLLTDAEALGGLDAKVLYVCARAHELLDNRSMAADLYKRALDLLLASP